jgi:hypothetical protein
MSVQTMEGIQMFHRLGLRDCPFWERRFVPIPPSELAVNRQESGRAVVLSSIA